MKQLTPEILREAASLIGRLRSGSLTDQESSAVVVRLNALLLDPRWFSYTVDHAPELSPEEVVRRAFEYRPFLVPDPTKRPQT